MLVNSVAPPVDADGAAAAAVDVAVDSNWVCSLQLIQIHCRNNTTITNTNATTLQELKRTGARTHKRKSTEGRKC